jgi:PAS domain S-box-containing protein
MDVEGRITLVNSAAERLLGAEAHQIEGRPYTDVFGPSLSNRLLNLFMRAQRADQTAAVHTITATLPTGRRAVLRANAGPLRDAAGSVTGVFFVADETQAPSSGTEEQLRQALQRYVGPAIARQIAHRPSFVGVGGLRQVVTILHSDVRGYTTLAEALPPEDVSSMLIRYHGAAVAALDGEGATLDRYIGDAILALWNAPTPQEEHARMAIRGALAMRRAVQAVGHDLEYGIGLHTGEAVVGNLGSDQYMHYTAIGDTVNVAARLQSAAPAGGIVCSAALLEAAGEGIQATPLGDLTVKGRKQAITAFAIDGIDA